MGRRPGFRYGPRLIDVDILLYGDSAVDLPGLQIPHPRLHQRAFALTPLAELAPGLIHPALGVTIAKMSAEADGRDRLIEMEEALGLEDQRDQGIEQAGE